MSPGSSTESYPAFAHIGLRENPGKNLNQVTCPDRESNPGHLVSRPDALTQQPKLSERQAIKLRMHWKEWCTGEEFEEKKISDDRRHGSFAETKRKAENRKDWRKLGLQ
ncbi:hypothetical protein ANN_19824 [Periplaneta americana]|uniref:Uncharacterized protein n=1 Tax=Periplaneta americana TaxID=6978 RepID=A0ABQ8SC06_PERAM|nr:hypothetical protein ANN_19824 [Periplaneta americana]